MLTLFTIPRSFTGQTGIRQRNAIGTWLRSIPDVEVMLMGDDPGVDAVAAELGVVHVPDVKRNEFGTPLLDSAFHIAEERARHDLIGYINTDILVLDDFVAALRHVTLSKFLVIGRRTDLDHDDAIVFDGAWKQRLLARAHEHGSLMHPYGSDYFVFRKKTGLAQLPPFAVGRPKWDNWFIANAQRIGVPVIDITPVACVIHQNHGYGHVAQSRGKTYEGPEGDRNLDLTQGLYGSVLDSDYRLTAAGLKRNTKLRWVGLRMWYFVDKRVKRLQNAMSASSG